MRVELFQFQKDALRDLRRETADALRSYQMTRKPQVVSFTAPTGSGKTIIMSALIESILRGDDEFDEQRNAVIVWLSDSPQLNEQSRLKIETKADRIGIGRCETVSEASFDMKTFEDGHVYFLNTQKLSRNAKLTTSGDSRTYTIWQTFANTIKEKGDRFYFIIDEAHRGTQGAKSLEDTTIMQKFIKGSEEDGIPPMPVVIGMSATTERFNALVEATPSTTIHKCVVKPEDVRESGLLKDRIVITYPEEGAGSNDMAILQAAAADWKEKRERWQRYCRKQQIEQVNPILIVQVLNGTAGKPTDTDLNECIAKIEAGSGLKLKNGEVVHAFSSRDGSSRSPSITVRGLDVRYEEPSRIADNKDIRVVFFKESLSTGWDCPRAETMMSFRSAKDPTYIAQLLGRMVRTPLQARIQADDVLNDVHLYLPYFNAETVKDVIDALQSSEGGKIADVFAEDLSKRRLETLTVRPKKAQEPIPPSQLAFDGIGAQEEKTESGEQGAAMPQEHQEQKAPDAAKEEPAQPADVAPKPAAAEQGSEQKDEPFDRVAVMEFINKAGVLSFKVKPNRSNNYLKSLLKLAHLITRSGLNSGAIKDVENDICDRIRDHIEGLKACGKYEELAQQVRSFKLSARIFDAFGKTINDYSVPNWFSASTEDIDRQLRIAATKLGGEGIEIAYGKKYDCPSDLNNFMDWKVDVILFAADEECVNKLHKYAKQRFDGLIDDYGPQFASLDSEKFRREFDSISDESDGVSQHIFLLPETIEVPSDEGGKEYKSHLFVNEATGTAKIKLNGWEADLIAEEEARPDFICWIRNQSKAAWALSIPYEISGETKAMYPDFIVVRRDEQLGYVLDILEPHRPDLADNLAKAKGLAKYVKDKPNKYIRRVQIIRKFEDAAGKSRFKRLRLEKREVRREVKEAINIEELDHFFEFS